MIEPGDLIIGDGDGMLCVPYAQAEEIYAAAKAKHDAETKQFVSAVTERLSDLSAAVTAAENMPTPRRRAAHAAISSQLEGIEADLMARLGLT